MRTFLLLLVALVSTSVEVVACQCGRKPTVEESLARSAAVVEGTLVSKRVVLGAWEDFLYPAVEYEFAVARVWGGEPSETLVLRGHYSNCSSYFDGAKTYLIFASRNDDSPGTLTSTICSRTASIAEAADDLVKLGPPNATFSAQIRPWAGIPAHHLLRTHFVAGIAGYVNFVRHFGHGSSSLGLLPVSIAVISIAALIVAAVLVRRMPRLSVALATFAVAVALAAVLLTGSVVLRNPYFAPFLSW